MDIYWKDVVKGFRAANNWDVYPAEYWIARASARRVGHGILEILVSEVGKGIDSATYEKVRAALADEIAPD